MGWPCPPLPDPSEYLDIYYVILWFLMDQRNRIDPVQLGIIAGIICLAVLAVILAGEIKKSSSKAKGKGMKANGKINNSEK